MNSSSKIDSAMRDLGISTDLQQFVKDLSQSDLDWDNLENGLIALAEQSQKALEDPGISQQDSLGHMIEKILMLPVGVCLPLTFANTLDPHVNFVLKHLRDFAKLLGPICESEYSVPFKIKAVQCFIHLYHIAAKVPLSIGSLVSVAILRMAVDSVVKLLNTQPMTAAELGELSMLLTLEAPSFERMIIGEIGFVYFRKDSESDDEQLEELRVQARHKPGSKWLFPQIRIIRTRPFVERIVSSVHFGNMLNCIRVLRSKGSEFGIKDYRKSMESSLPICRLTRHFRGGLSTGIFLQVFLFELKPKAVAKWLEDTISVFANDKKIPEDANGEWGFASIAYTEEGIRSHLYLTSFFGGPLEYVVRLSRQHL